MPRLLGIDIPEHKKLVVALTSLYGVGHTRAALICKEANVDPDKRARDVTTNELNRIQRVLERFPLEGDLRREVNDNIDRLIRIRSYRGSRHQAHLPARGQRTRSNARNARGGVRRRTVGSLSKEDAAKTEDTKAK